MFRVSNKFSKSAQYFLLMDLNGTWRQGTCRRLCFTRGLHSRCGTLPPSDSPRLATKGKLDSPQVAVCQSQVAQDCHLAPIGIMIPSGKHTKNDGKSPCLMGQSTINHQRVNRSIANFSHRTIRCQMVSTCQSRH